MSKSSKHGVGTNKNKEGCLTMRFMEKLMRFMYGRNGFDTTTNAVFVFYFVLLVVNLFARSFVINILMLLCILYAVFRILSKNLERRRAENEKFMKVWRKFEPSFRQFFTRAKEINTHRYRKCPHCAATLRLPRKVGKHTVVCPRCRKEFEVKILL